MWGSNRFIQCKERWKWEEMSYFVKKVQHIWKVYLIIDQCAFWNWHSFISTPTVNNCWFHSFNGHWLRDMYFPHYWFDLLIFSDNLLHLNHVSTFNSSMFAASCKSRIFLWDRSNWYHLQITLYERHQRHRLGHWYKGSSG